MRIPQQRHAAAIACICASGALIDAGDVRAQENTAPTEDNSALEEIVVTGSLIARRDFTASSPIVSIDAGLIEASGASTLEAALNQLPQFAASAGAATLGRGGQANVNLRGLGQQRTLVLLDGRRVQPANPDGSVDLNVIPPELLSGAEVITGGASAIYGSDAVTGVVNLKLRRNIEGAHFSTRYAAADAGGGRTLDTNAIFGNVFDEGSGFLALSYSDRGAVDFASHDYLEGHLLSSNLPNGVLVVNAANLPTAAAVNDVFAQYGVAPGVVRPNRAIAFNDDGTLFQAQPAINYRGSTTSPIYIRNGNLFQSSGDDVLSQEPLTRYSVFGRMEHEVAEHARAFGQALYTNYTARTQGPPVVAGGSNSVPVVIDVTNPFIPDDLATLLASRPSPNAPFTITTRLNPVGKRGDRNDYDVFQLIAGFEGDFVERDWTWNIHGSYGKTTFVQALLNYPSSAALQRLLSAPDGGASICAGGWNPFGVQSISRECIEYISRTARSSTTLEQSGGDALLQGGLFDLPAGELRFAVGASHREQSYEFLPDALVATGEVVNFLPTASSGGSMRTSEVFSELLVPLVSDVPLVRKLSLDLGYRYSDYNTVGGVNTYKSDIDWDVTDSFKVRGGYARAIRAPSVGELFRAQTLSSVPLGNPGALGSGDPCDVRGAYRAAGYADAAQVRALCLAQGVPANLIDTFTNTIVNTPFSTAGNEDLEAETADTYTLGLVWEPEFANAWLANLFTSIDYYSIDLAGAIGNVTSGLAVSNCFNAAASNPGYSTGNFFCGLVTRDPNTGLISNVVNPLLNLGGYQVKGVDAQIEWAVNLADAGVLGSTGRLSLGTMVSYLDEFSIQSLPGATARDYAGTILDAQIDPAATAKPRWKATTSAGYERGPFDVAVRWRYLGAMDNANNVGTSGTAPGVEAVSLFDVDTGIKLGGDDQYSVRIGVINATDEPAPLFIPSAGGILQTETNVYDLIGRRYYVTLKAQF